jgi:hypothetical protein
MPANSINATTLTAAASAAGQKVKGRHPHQPQGGRFQHVLQLAHAARHPVKTAQVSPAGAKAMPPA